MAIMVAQGLGVCVVPRSPALLQLTAMQRLQEISLGPDPFYRSIGMIWRKDSGPLPLIKNFATALGG
jgi:DNA-binding transcriptional LysR family regulator